MIIKDVRIITREKDIPNGYLIIESGKIAKVGEGDCSDPKAISKKGLIAFPGFIDVHIHGSVGIDFMDAKVKDYEAIADSLYKEGVTTFLATTLTSDEESLAKVCRNVKEAKKTVASLEGIHFEGPYISLKYKGAQNPDYIRNPDIAEFKRLQALSDNNVKYISMAPEKEGSMEFIKEISATGVVISAGHTDATFDDMEKAIANGLTNTTHTHNAMSPHHHRNPGVVTAAFYFDSLFCEVICDLVHVSPNTLKTFFKIVGPDRFVAITDALKVKHSNEKEFQLFGLDCVVKPDAAYLTSGPLAGSLLSMDQGLRNLRSVTGASYVDLAKMTSGNAARSLHLSDRGFIEEGKLADIVLLDGDLTVKEVYKNGERKA